MRFSFEPADIVSEVMSFGSPTPIEVAVSGPDFAETAAFRAEAARRRWRRSRRCATLQFAQALDYPTVKVDIDRERAGMLGVTAEQVGRSLTEATSSSRFAVPNFWADPKSGVGYQVQVEVPSQRMNSVEEVENIPISRSQDGRSTSANVADVTQGTMPGEYDRYNMQRMLTLDGQYRRRGPGPRGATSVVAGARRGWAPPPQGVNVDVRGQIVPMQEMFGGLELGLMRARSIVIFLLLAANFQSFRLALAIVLDGPGGGRGRGGRALAHRARR